VTGAKAQLYYLVISSELSRADVLVLDILPTSVDGGPVTFQPVRSMLPLIFIRFAVVNSSCISLGILDLLDKVNDDQGRSCI